MIIRRFCPVDEETIISIYKACFSGPPWNQDVTEEEAAARWYDHSSRFGFTCFVAVKDQQVVGASWFDVISCEKLIQERGRELGCFVISINPTLPVVWIRETIVIPLFHGQRIASQLKECIMLEIKECLAPAILLTRMRDDNIGIIRVNERLGFNRTGIKAVSNTTPGLLHEYWYLILNKE